MFSAFSRAAQNCANASYQFTRIKRLGQIIIGADFKSHDAINVLAARRKREARECGSHHECGAARQNHSSREA